MSREMKHSGIEWIGQIPKEWEVIKGKHLLNLMCRPVRETDDVVTCFRDGEVILRSERRTEGFTMSDKEIGYQGINEGDIVIHGMDGFAGAMGISKSTGKGSPVLIVCNPKGIDDSRYIIYYLRTLAITNVFIALATGIRERSCDLRWNKISVLPFIRPQSITQQKIADYLDKVCGEVDEMVALQETMIEELKAYKQSVITEAVTKGLNPNVSMRDSGIDWIGNIPEGWKVSKLKYYIKVDSGDAITAEKISDNGLYPVYGGGEIMGYYSDYNISEDYLIIGRVGARCGCVTMPNKKSWATDNALIINSVLDKQYLFYLLQGANLNRLNTSNAQPLITATKMKNVYVPIVDYTEQQQIASYLDTKCSEIDSLIALKQSKIEELKEYKKSVIYEYVTGKKEVA